MVRAIDPGSAPRRRLTADEFDKMVEAGILHEDDHVELLDGELFQKAAMGGPHVTCVMRITNSVTPRIVGKALISVQSSFRLGYRSEPEPDIVLLRYRDDMYGDVLPRPEDVLLIIEVADSTLRYDRDVKVPLYAAGGIPETWLVDLRRRRITVYREPTTDGYRQVISQTRRAVLSPLLLPELQMRWEDVFGQA
jgi:Uma2 family endonuclease